MHYWLVISGNGLKYLINLNIRETTYYTMRHIGEAERDPYNQMDPLSTLVLEVLF